MTAWIPKVFLCISCESLRELRAVLKWTMARERTKEGDPRVRGAEPCSPLGQRGRGREGKARPQKHHLERQARWGRIPGYSGSNEMSPAHTTWNVRARSVTTANDFRLRSPPPPLSGASVSLPVSRLLPFTCTQRSSSSARPEEADHVERVSVRHKKGSNPDTESFEQPRKHILRVR